MQKIKELNKNHASHVAKKNNFIVVLRSLVYCIFCTFARILNKIEGSYVVSHNFLLVLMSVLIIS